MPVAAVVEDKILCMHGGISPELQRLGQILDIPRPIDVPDEGLLCDLLWSDPESSISGRVDSFPFNTRVFLRHVHEASPQYLV